ncbi:MAG: sulfatase-like hydrolase/transferase [Candidatus Limnocylindria bacterium]
MLTARGGPSQRRLSELPLHPLLAAAYPVVFLFATNAAEQVTLAPLWVPLGLAVAGTAVVLLVLGLVTRDWHWAALLTTVLVAAFFGYGHAWVGFGSVLDNQWPLIAAWVLLVAVLLFAAWRFRGVARRMTPALNLVAALLLLMNSWSLTQAVVAHGASDSVQPEAPSLELDPGLGEAPDVYNIILDRYAGGTALADFFDFDNEPFLTALEERGFQVARHAHANYIKTPLSLVSSLNMDYLDAEQLQSEQESGRDRDPIHRLLRGRLAVPSLLKEIGYQYVHVANWWQPSATNVDADRVFRYSGQDEFSTVLAQTTLLRAFNEPEAAPSDPYDWRILYNHTRYALDKLEQIPDIPGPKFVFAHLLIPHDPYVFNTDGSFTGRALVAERGRVDSYRRQLQYANTRILEIIDRILAESPDAVILLQADEGPFPARYADDEWAFRWRDATDAELEEKFGILFAMRVPRADVEAAGFHDAITPVNAWRIIFNARFGTDLPMFPERSWAHVSLYDFFDFFEITDRLR